MAPPSSSSSTLTIAQGADDHPIDVEKLKTGSHRSSHWRLVWDQAHITPEVLNWPYKGSGTDENPYVVEYILNDERNPMLFSQRKKWALTMLVAAATLAVSFVSSAFSGGMSAVIIDFDITTEIATLGISLFVLGFAVGPLIWAPMSELYGRQVLFFGTYAMLTAFNAGAAGSKNITTLIVLRFFAGAFGSSPLTNAGGVIADMFPASQRGLAMSVFAAAPFLGPTLGPIAGGFVGEVAGWRWVEGLMAIFTCIVWVSGTLCIPETYSPLILRKRARQLSLLTNNVYKSKLEIQHGAKTITQEFSTALSRPWLLLFREPIVFLLSIYMAIVYGTLYMMFAAFPIVYQQDRGWSPGVGGLSFLGVMVGELLAVAYSIFYTNKKYMIVSDAHNGAAPPEARLPPTMVGSIFLPLGLFVFAWTNYTSVHWAVSIIATAPFGFGMVLVFLSISNYLIDSYVIYAASVMAANSVLRSLFGAAFPLFTGYMYRRLGIHWASCVPAFLALACVPFPFLFYRHGESIRLRCEYAAEAAKVLDEMRSSEEESVEAGDVDFNVDGVAEKRTEVGGNGDVRELVSREGRKENNLE